MKTSVQVQMEHLACTLDQFRIMGGNIRNLSRASLIRELLKNERNVMVPFEVCAETMEEAARLVGRSDFGVLVAKRRMELGYSHEIIAFAQSCRTVEDAFRGITTSLRARTLGITYEFEVYGNVAGIVRGTPTELHGRYQQATLAWATTVIMAFRQMTQQRWAPDVLMLVGRPLSGVSRIEQRLGCYLQFNAENDGIFFDSKHLLIELPTWNNLLNALLNEYLESKFQVEERDFTGTVRTIIKNSLMKGRSDIQHVAAQLGLRPRTLQLRLQDRGVTYSALLKECRFKLAENLLTNSDISMTEIAQRLGYQELSAFTRAFKKLYGSPPSKWRGADSAQNDKSDSRLDK